MLAELNLNKIHSIVNRWTGDDDMSWDLLSEAYLSLDRSRTIPEQATYLVMKSRYLYLNQATGTREIPFSSLENKVSVSYDDDDSVGSSLQDILTASEDEPTAGQITSGVLSRYHGSYRKELATFLLYVMNGKYYETTKPVSVELVRRCLRKFGFTKASRAATEIDKFLRKTFQA